MYICSRPSGRAGNTGGTCGTGGRAVRAGGRAGRAVRAVRAGDLELYCQQVMLPKNKKITTRLYKITVDEKLS